MTTFRSRNARIGRRFALHVALAVALSLPSAVGAVPLPPVERVAFAPPTSAVLPLHAVFTDESGRRSELGAWLRARPAIVVPAYYGCSNLCTTTLRATRAAIDAAGLHAGRDVDVVAISIAPLETPALARSKKRDVLGDEATQRDDGWHFLTGDEASIEQVTRQLGYRYAYVAAERQYAHAAGIAVVAPDGRVARVLYGVAFPSRDLRAALASATAPAAIDSPVETSGPAASWLLCFHYDPTTGRYTFVAMNAARAAGLLALAGLVGYATFAWRRERRGATRGHAR